jgi:hypothetical protein
MCGCSPSRKEVRYTKEKSGGSREKGDIQKKERSEIAAESLRRGRNNGRSSEAALGDRKVEGETSRQ